MTNLTPNPQPYFDGNVGPKKPGWLRKNAPLLIVAAIALFLGVAIGAAGTSGGAEDAAAPTPAKTVTVEKEVPVEDGCRDVALELFDMLETMNGQVVIPISSGASEAINAYLVMDVAGIEAATAKVQQANEVQISLTSRVEAVGPAYIECVG